MKIQMKKVANIMCHSIDVSAKEMNHLVQNFPEIYDGMYPNGVVFHDAPILKTCEKGFITNASDLVQWLKETKCSFYLTNPQRQKDLILYWSPNVQDQISVRYVGYQSGPAFETIENFISECSLIK